MLGLTCGVLKILSFWKRRQKIWLSVKFHSYRLRLKQKSKTKSQRTHIYRWYRRRLRGRLFLDCPGRFYLSFSVFLLLFMYGCYWALLNIYQDLAVLGWTHEIAMGMSHIISRAPTVYVLCITSFYTTGIRRLFSRLLWSELLRPSCVTSSTTNRWQSYSHKLLGIQR